MLNVTSRSVKVVHLKKSASIMYQWIFHSLIISISVKMKYLTDEQTSHMGAGEGQREVPVLVSGPSGARRGRYDGRTGGRGGNLVGYFSLRKGSKIPPQQISRLVH